MTGSGRNQRSRRTPEAGREKLLDAARTLFQAKIKHEVSRQDIARKAGVAPGLLTYYFQDNVDLVLAATHPVLATAIARLIQALDSPEPCEDRFKQCVKLFLDFAEDNSSLLDVYIQYATESGDGQAQALIGSVLHRLGAFFGEAVESGFIAKETNPQFLLLALWGMCRLVGGSRPYPLHIVDGDEQPGDTRQHQIDLISHLVLHGVGSTQSSRPRVRKAPRRRQRTNVVTAP